MKRLIAAIALIFTTCSAAIAQDRIPNEPLPGQQRIDTIGADGRYTYNIPNRDSSIRIDLGSRKRVPPFNFFTLFLFLHNTGRQAITVPAALICWYDATIMDANRFGSRDTITIAPGQTARIPIAFRMHSRLNMEKRGFFPFRFNGLKHTYEISAKAVFVD